jgi:hypothetical protein
MRDVEQQQKNQGGAGRECAGLPSKNQFKQQRDLTTRKKGRSGHPPSAGSVLWVMPL